MEVKVKYSHFPSSWKVIKLGDFVEHEKGKKPKFQKNLPSIQYNIPYIDIEAFEKNILKSWTDGEGCRFCTENDFLIVWDGSRSGLVGKGMNGALGSTLVRINFPKIRNQYAFYFMQSKFLEINSRAKGSGTPHVDPDLLWNYDFPIPPLNEQRRIVAKIEELFSELNKGVESLKAARAQLKTYRQAVLKHAFEGKLTAKWREENKDKLEPVDKLLERIPKPDQPKGGRKASIEVIEGLAALAVNRPNKRAPSGWTWVPLLRIARQETGHTPSRKYPEYWGGENCWIGIKDARLHHGKIIYETIQKVSKLGLENSSARILPDKTVCISRTASVGYVCIMGKPMATSQDFATWTCSEALEPKFLMLALIAEGEEIRRFGKGTTHTTIYFPEIRALNICLPPLLEQQAIVELVEHKLQRIGLIEKEIDTQLQKSEALHQSILKKAFSGQLVPQDSNDEPASVLLERIRAEKETQAKSKTKTNKKPKRKTVGVH